MFIVRILIIKNTQDHHIYSRTERRGKGLAAGETERECVCERQRVGENRVSLLCKKRPLESDWPFWDNLRIIKSYFNGGQRLQRYIKIIKNISADAWRHLVRWHFAYISHIICKIIVRFVVTCDPLSGRDHDGEGDNDHAGATVVEPKVWIQSYWFIDYPEEAFNATGKACQWQPL